MNIGPSASLEMFNEYIHVDLLIQWVAAFCYTTAINRLLDLEIEILDSNVCTIEEIRDMIDNAIFEIESKITKEPKNDN